MSLKTRALFDFVICEDVLQYLTSSEATAAIDNLARLSRATLYFGVLTKEDWDNLLANAGARVGRR